MSAKVGLDNTAGSAEQQLLDSWLNEGVREVLLRTHAYVTSATATPGATSDYTLPTAILDIVEMYFGDNDYPLERRSLNDITLLRRGTGTGSVRYYAPLGANAIAFYPTPGAADILTYYYVPRPTEMSEAADDPSDVTYGGIPPEYHKAIEYYALWQASEFDDNPKVLQYRAEFEAYLKKMKAQVTGKSGTRLSRAVVGRRRNAPSVPSQDIR